MASTTNLTSTLDNMSITDRKSSPSKKEKIVDSWEDESDSTETEEQENGLSTPVRPSTAQYPDPPPPTPASPTSPSSKIPAYRPSFSPSQFGSVLYESTVSPESRLKDGEEKRPEKTTAVASRLIAAGLGQKAPKRTQEQREYDQAMKIQEKKKRDQVKEAEARKKTETEQAKKAIWDD